MIDIAHVRDGMVEYISDNVITHLPVQQQLLAGMILGVARSRADGIISELAKHPAVKMLGVMDGQKIDIDVLYQAAKEQMQKIGKLSLDIPMIGSLTFDESDLDTLYRSISKR